MLRGKLSTFLSPKLKYADLVFLLKHKIMVHCTALSIGSMCVTECRYGVLQQQLTFLFVTHGIICDCVRHDINYALNTEAALVATCQAVFILTSAFCHLPQIIFHKNLIFCPGPPFSHTLFVYCNVIFTKKFYSQVQF